MKQTLDELRSLTRPQYPPRPGSSHPARLFGKDLLAAVDILKRAPLLFRKQQGNERLAKETLTSFTETASNVLDLNNQDTWFEIQEVSSLIFLLSCKLSISCHPPCDRVLISAC